MFHQNGFYYFFFFFFKKKEIWKPGALGYISSSASLKFVDPFCTTSLHPAHSQLNLIQNSAWHSHQPHPSSAEESKNCKFQPSYKNLPALSKTRVLDYEHWQPNQKENNNVDGNHVYENNSFESSM